jgi:hypothetical protein
VKRGITAKAQEITLFPLPAAGCGGCLSSQGSRGREFGEWAAAAAAAALFYFIYIYISPPFSVHLLFFFCCFSSGVLSRERGKGKKNKIAGRSAGRRLLLMLSGDVVAVACGPHASLTALLFFFLWVMRWGPTHLVWYSWEIRWRAPTSALLFGHHISSLVPLCVIFLKHQHLDPLSNCNTYTSHTSFDKNHTPPLVIL